MRSTRAPAVAITCDIDWAPGWVVEHALSLFEEAGVRATIFATGPSPSLQGTQDHEIGIHPHFADPDDPRPEIEALLEAYPRAKGERSHRLVTNDRVTRSLVELGFLYESNESAPEGRDPYIHDSGIVRFPIYLGDHANLMGARVWDAKRIFDGKPEARLFVFNFHPIHLFLNTNSLEHYEQAKHRLQDGDALRRLRNDAADGTESLFRSVTGDVTARGLRLTTLVEEAHRLRSIRALT